MFDFLNIEINYFQIFVAYDFLLIVNKDKFIRIQKIPAFCDN